MALVADLRKSLTDATPVLAAVGVTDLAVEKIRDARGRAGQVRAELDVNTLQSRASQRVAEVAEQAQQVPALALNGSLVAASRVQESYDALASRGEKLVKRVRTQKATKDLLAQVETTVAMGKGAVTTVRRAADDIERSAKATLTTGRRETAVATDAVVESAVQEAKDATATVATSAARTRTAAKRTATTTRKRATATRTATKRATTSARKTAKAAGRASTTAAEKVGD